MSMIYTLIEFAKEKHSEWSVHQKDRQVIVKEETAPLEAKKPKEKKVDIEFIWIQPIFANSLKIY